jgi:hypothetical protein
MAVAVTEDDRVLPLGAHRRSERRLKTNPNEANEKSLKTVAVCGNCVLDAE